MSKVIKSFICGGYLNLVMSTGHTSVDIGAGANLELVDKFCYLYECGWRCLCSCGGQNLTHTHTHTRNRFTALLEYVRDHPGEQVPER